MLTAFDQKMNMFVALHRPGG